MNQLYQQLVGNQVSSNLFANSPQMKQVMDYVKANGGNPKDAFYKLAKEKGVDPQSIINQVNNFAKL